MADNDNLEYRQDEDTATAPSAPPRPIDQSDPPYQNLPSDKPPGENPPSDSAGGNLLQEEARGEGPPRMSDGELIAKAHEIYTTSTDYLDANITNQWETNLNHFNNQHAPGSVYVSKNWKRSRVFRPKSRASVKGAEAAMAAAAFSTQDVVDIQPEDQLDEQQRISAQINKNILHYRLDKKLKWFQTAIGAFQDTKVYGVCFSHNYWRYSEDTDVVPAFRDDGSLMQDEDGTPLGYEQSVVRHDDLCCDNIAPENFRFDPMCDWRDPITTSPYLVYMMPVYAGEALERMEALDPKTGQPIWKKHSLGELLATRRQNYDRTRQAREGKRRIDPADEQHGNEYTVIWAHMNIVKMNGTDMMFWTMGTEILLSDPVPLTVAYPHLREGQRPFTMGVTTIEAHRNYPAGDIEQSSGLQEEINSIANQRLDNVKLVLNKRYHVRRGAQVDLDALVRNVPGGGVMMNDPEKDVVTVNTPDVTASSYQEQDRLAVEMDELIGAFSQSSVQSNRALNETVGGMSMMGQSANSVSDYQIRLFFETWMETTLRQMVQLIQFYETDANILALAAKHSDAWQRYGIDQVTDEMLQQELTVRVNVGMGNTDPMRRVEKLIFGVQQAVSIPGMVERIKAPEITNEIFGSLGYRDSSRFFMNDEEASAKAEQAAANAQPPPEIALKEKELALRQEDNQLRDEREKMRLEMDAQLGFAKLALEKELTLEQLYANLGMEEQKVKTTRDATALRETNKIHEMGLKRATGSGI